MTAEDLKKEFEIRTLKQANINLSLKLKTAETKLNDKIINEVKYKTTNKKLLKIIKIKEDLEQRLIKKLAKKVEEIKEKKQEIKEQKQEIEDQKRQIEALKAKIKDQEKAIDKMQTERDKYLAELNLDGTTAGIPTSQTPINKKKIIPNTRVKTGAPKGGQLGHVKKILPKFDENEITEIKKETLTKCPNCGNKDLKELENAVIKDELDYEIRIIKKRHYFIEYECNSCHKKVRKQIPNNLKEENQYGNYVQAHVLSLTNIGNVPFNKTRRIIAGLTSGEINLSEGYIAKLQKRANNLLENFIKELKEYILKLKVLHWDDTVIFVNTKRACLRTYCDNDIALYTAHLTKGKEGLDEDEILSKLSSQINVIHDHNKVNYNKDYIYTNVECCVHLERDLEKVKLNIPESTWSKKLKELFSTYNQKRNKYIIENIKKFSFEETNDFMIKFDEYILLGTEENKKHGKSHYFKDEKALLARLIEYRDNYTYWLYDFSLPYSNNSAERSLRGVKTKMKVSGQFINIDNAKYYANIRSYIETCTRNKINEVEALIRLLNGNPFTVNEIIENGKISKIKKED